MTENGRVPPNLQAKQQLEHFAASVSAIHVVSLHVTSIRKGHHENVALLRDFTAHSEELQEVAILSMYIAANLTITATHVEELHSLDLTRVALCSLLQGSLLPTVQFERRPVQFHTTVLALAWASSPSHEHMTEIPFVGWNQNSSTRGRKAHDYTGNNHNSLSLPNNNRARD